MEFCSGGELFEKIVKMTDYNEVYAAKLMKQIFYIIRDLHKADIIHQDLKPENLLLMSPDSMIIKLCDFGLAESADDSVELFGKVGSATYMAPEVVAETGHHKPVDMYAAGVILYILLCGYPPFEPENNIVTLEFPDDEWSQITDAAKELIVRLLDKIPSNRGTPDEILKDKWFIDVETIKNPKCLTGTIDTLKKYQQQGPYGTRGAAEQDRPQQPKRNSIIGLFDDNKHNNKDDKGGKKPKKSSIDTLPLQLLSPKKKSGKKTSIANLPKKKKNRAHRASTGFGELLKGEEDEDFNPKDIFDLHRKWDDDFKVRLQLEQLNMGTRKKKEDRKSQKRPTLKKPPLPTTPRSSGSKDLDNLLDSIYRELRYNRDTMEYLENTVIHNLKKDIDSESDHTKIMSNRFNSSISNVRAEAIQEQVENKNIRNVLEALQNKPALATSSPPTFNKKKKPKK